MSIGDDNKRVIKKRRGFHLSSMMVTSEGRLCRVNAFSVKVSK